MVTRRGYLELVGGTAAAVTGLHDKNRDKKYSEKQKGTEEACTSNPSPADRMQLETLPTELAEAVEEAEYDMHHQVRGRASRTLNPNSVTVDLYACPDDDEYTAVIAAETKSDSRFASINDYLDEGDRSSLENDLAESYGPLLQHPMEQLLFYRPGGNDADAATIRTLTAEINGYEDGQLIATFDEDSLEEAYRHTKRENGFVRRDRLAWMARNNLELERTY